MTRTYKGKGVGSKTIDLSEPEISGDVQSGWYLKITPEQFTEIYGTAVDVSIFTDPIDSNDDLMSCMQSKLWRLNNLYTIIDKDGMRVKFRMNYAQHVVYAASLQHARLIILKSRQQGISTFWLISFLDDALFIPDMNIGLMAQGEDEASTLLKRVKLAYETFSEELRQFLSMSIIRDNTKETAFSNDSTIFIRTSFRSATLQRLHISEFGKIANRNPERAIETKTGTLQAIRPGNTVVIESTAEGDNAFKQMWDSAIEAEARVLRLGTGVYSGKDFKPVFLPWYDDPDCNNPVHEEPSRKQAEYFAELEVLVNIKLTDSQKNFWIAQYRELDKRTFQEYPATPDEAFTRLNEGSYYGKPYMLNVVQKQRVVPRLYDPNIEVNVAMDLGMNDLFTMVYFQRYDKWWRIIDEYKNHSEGLEHYVDHMRNSGYKINFVVAPHDIRVRGLNSGISREDRLRQLGVERLLVLEKSPIADGIEEVRKILPFLWMDESLEYLPKCLKNYSKAWDERTGTWKQTPNHDEWSHGADAIRYMAQSRLSRAEVRTPARQRNTNFVVDGMAL